MQLNFLTTTTKNIKKRTIQINEQKTMNQSNKQQHIEPERYICYENIEANLQIGGVLNKRNYEERQTCS